MLLNEQKIRLDDKKVYIFKKLKKSKPSLRYSQFFDSLEINNFVPENHPMEINRKKNQLNSMMCNMFIHVLIDVNIFSP